MRRAKPRSSPKRKLGRKKQSRSTRKDAITWADPSARKTKTSKRKKTKLTKNDMKKNSCWWFG